MIFHNLNTNYGIQGLDNFELFNFDLLSSEHNAHSLWQEYLQRGVVKFWETYYPQDSTFIGSSTRELGLIAINSLYIFNTQDKKRLDNWISFVNKIDSYYPTHNIFSIVGRLYFNEYHEIYPYSNRYGAVYEGFNYDSYTGIGGREMLLMPTTTSSLPSFYETSLDSVIKHSAKANLYNSIISSIDSRNNPIISKIDPSVISEILFSKHILSYAIHACSEDVRAKRPSSSRVRAHAAYASSYFSKERLPHEYIGLKLLNLTFNEVHKISKPEDKTKIEYYLQIMGNVPHMYKYETGFDTISLLHDLSSIPNIQKCLDIVYLEHMSSPIMDIDFNA